MASIKLDGNTLTSTELSLVAMGEKVEIASDAWIKVDAARKVVDNILESGETVYGINTGFGGLTSQSYSITCVWNWRKNEHIRYKGHDVRKSQFAC